MKIQLGLTSLIIGVLCQGTPQTVFATDAPAAAPMKFSGFFDFRYTDFSAKDDAGNPTPHAESGFGLEDGAVYGNFEKDKVSIFLDISLRRTKEGDYTSTPTVANQSVNNNFIVAAGPSQLYLKYKVTGDLVVDFGQFDTIYGVELNDSKDRVFGKTGLVYDYTLPVTHSGAMIEHSANGVSAKIFGANPNNKGSYGTSSVAAEKDDKTEYGAALGYSNETMRAQLGYMARPVVKAGASGDLANRTLMDLTLGATVGALSVDLEYAAVNDPRKNSLTPLATDDAEKAGTGTMVLATYKLSDAALIGVRYEQLQDDPAVTSVKTATSTGISIHYKLSPELEARFEQVTYSFKNVSDATWTNSRSNVAAVMTF